MTPTDSAKTILCYGDSNTWGAVPNSNQRYPRSVRWTGALQNLLGDGYEVVSEGLCGRTFVAHDPTKPHRTGINHLHAILESADPIDLVIVMLGTNDVKSTYNLDPEDIAEHLDETIHLIKSKKVDLEKVPKIIVICPPPVIVPTENKLDERMVRGVELFKELPALYKEVAEKNSCGFINAGDHISSSPIDGYHLDPEAHAKLAQVLQRWIQKNI
jgi:lysophospholipase L1-like esterase